MEIYLNGERENVSPGDGPGVALRKGLRDARVVRVYTGQVLPEEDWGEPLEEEAAVEVLTIVGGG